MTRRQRHRVVEEEDRGPSSRCIERMSPALIFGDAGDPELAAMVTGDPTGLVDQTSPVPGEKTAFRDRMKVSPGVDPVTTRHRIR
jgi:hypothetical protein